MENISKSLYNRSNDFSFNISWDDFDIEFPYKYCKYWDPQTDAVIDAQVSAQVVFSVLGIVGNIFVIVLATKYTERRNLNYLIVNMAISDVLLLLALLIEKCVESSIEKWDGLYQDIECGARIFIQNLSYRVTLSTLLVISIERFRATRVRLQISRPYTLKIRVTVVCVCWLIPTVISAFYTHFSFVLQICGKVKLPNYSTFHFYLWIFYTLLTIAICSGIFIIAILTTRRLSKLQPIHAHLTEHQQNMRKRRQQAAVRMVLASALLCTCCWLPYLMLDFVFFPTVMNIVTSFEAIVLSTCIDWNLLVYLVVFLLIINSFFSPFIYIIFLPAFRQAAKKLLYRRQTPNQTSRSMNVISCN